MLDVTRVTTALTIPRTRNDMIVAGFLARYGNEHTFEGYRTDLKILFDWCGHHGLDPIVDVERPHLELFARHLELERHNRPATVNRRIAAIKMFYWLAEEDGHIAKSPARNVRLPKVHQDKTRTMGMSRAEFAAIHTAAQKSTNRVTDEALVMLMGILGMRVSEVCELDIANCQGAEGGHRVITFVGKGGKPATLPMPVPVMRAVDAAIGDRTSGPLLLRRDGTAMTRRSADRVVKRLANVAGIKKTVSPHSFRNTMIVSALDAGVPLRDVQDAARHSDPRMTMKYDHARKSLDRHASYVVSTYIGAH
ncbi:tyrosine-type recombinase/integrase [Rhodococcus tibetensis]|uniref:Tyrosine-type recombinase/integrase n=1 Tax=Rhodococcus tibetensis TaxID=2965064 RepID=A0ABT1QCC0_9NOCA|nr:tyrosine-type recombinase/integrase [Rhodococcus sp. FXJ9.536]MCQ4119906.1 tyrosine-type recombinase/integrase [Rhodococcus sp. FXJ9.536]